MLATLFTFVLVTTSLAQIGQNDETTYNRKTPETSFDPHAGHNHSIWIPPKTTLTPVETSVGTYSGHSIPSETTFDPHAGHNHSISSETTFYDNGTSVEANHTDVSLSNKAIVSLAFLLASFI
jgi:hypothetical protein